MSIDPNAWRRVQNAVKRVERMDQGVRPQRRRHIVAQHGVLVIGVTVASPGASTATVDSRPPGMSTVPGETAGSVPIENPANIPIPVGGLSGHAVYCDRGATRQWELIADSVGQDSDDPPAPRTAKAVYQGVTTVLHERDTSEDVTLWIGGVETDVACFNPLYHLPPETVVLVAYVETEDGPDWTIISCNAQGFLGTANSTYAKGATGEFLIFSDTSTYLGVNIEAKLPFGGISGADWAWIAFNGHIFVATAKEC